MAETSGRRLRTCRRPYQTRECCGGGSESHWGQLEAHRALKIVRRGLENPEMGGRAFEGVCEILKLENASDSDFLFPRAAQGLKEFKVTCGA